MIKGMSNITEGFQTTHEGKKIERRRYWEMLGSYLYFARVQRIQHSFGMARAGLFESRSGPLGRSFARQSRPESEGVNLSYPTKILGYAYIWICVVAHILNNYLGIHQGIETSTVLVGPFNR
jgi:hypothetical protein